MKIAPCLNCGSENIKLSNYEDTFGCISGGTCNFCKNSFSENHGSTKEHSIKIWNDNNDVTSLISQELDKIKKSEEIINLLQTKRENVLV